MTSARSSRCRLRRRGREREGVRHRHYPQTWLPSRSPAIKAKPQTSMDNRQAQEYVPTIDGSPKARVRPNSTALLPTTLLCQMHSALCRQEQPLLASCRICPSMRALSTADPKAPVRPQTKLMPALLPPICRRFDSRNKDSRNPRIHLRPSGFCRRAPSNLHDHVSGRRRIPLLNHRVQTKPMSRRR